MAVSSERENAPRRPYAPRLPPEERREQLLDAALHIAAEHGFAAVTMDRVARAAGVTRPVVYGLFADRSALVAALLVRETERAQLALANVLPHVPAGDEAVDADELLVQGLRAYLTTVSEAPDTWRLVLFPAEGAPPELQQTVTTSRAESLEQVRRLLTWGMAARRSGVASDPLDVELFAHMVVGLAEGAARMVLNDPATWTVDRFTVFARQMLGALAVR